MTPPSEYANYLSFLGFDDIQEPYIIMAAPRSSAFIPDDEYSWEKITWALESGHLLRGSRKLEEVKNLIEGMERECGIWLDGFPTKEVWRKGR